jgi:hypothetical protein
MRQQPGPPGQKRTLTIDALAAWFDEAIAPFVKDS